MKHQLGRITQGGVAKHQIGMNTRWESKRIRLKGLQKAGEKKNKMQRIRRGAKVKHQIGRITRGEK